MSRIFDVLDRGARWAACTSRAVARAVAEWRPAARSLGERAVRARWTLLGLALLAVAATVLPRVGGVPEVAAPAPVAAASGSGSARPAAAKSAGGTSHPWLSARDLATAGALADELVTAPAPAAGGVAKSERLPTPREQADAAHREAIRSVERGEPEAAVAALRSALELDPSHRAARRSLVTLLLRAGDLVAARSAADAGLALDPAQPELITLVARILAEEGATAEALRHLERAAPLLAADPEYHAFRAALYQQLGDHESASGLYAEALRQRPRSAPWWMGLGISLEGRGRRVEAGRAYRNALALGALDATSRGWVEGRLSALGDAS
jgi:MSHA biogenesis protein MshN